MSENERENSAETSATIAVLSAQIESLSCKLNTAECSAVYEKQRASAWQDAALRCLDVGINGAKYSIDRTNPETVKTKIAELITLMREKYVELRAENERLREQCEKWSTESEIMRGSHDAWRDSLLSCLRHASGYAEAVPFACVGGPAGAAKRVMDHIDDLRAEINDSRADLECLRDDAKNPIAGIGALTKNCVTLSDVQKQQIKDFMAVNDVASAQAVILADLECLRDDAVNPIATATQSDRLVIAVKDVRFDVFAWGQITACIVSGRIGDHAIFPALGYATCHSDDKYDLRKGALLAARRALDAHLEAWTNLSWSSGRVMMQELFEHRAQVMSAVYHDFGRQMYAEFAK